MDCATLQAALDAVNLTIGPLTNARDAASATASASAAVAAAEQVQAESDATAATTAQNNLDQANSAATMYVSMLTALGCPGYGA